MSADDIRGLLRHKPLVPFRFRLVSGDAYEIRDPNSVALGRERVCVAFTDSDGMTLFSYLDIAAVESITSRQSRGGARRKRGR